MHYTLYTLSTRHFAGPGKARENAGAEREQAAQRETVPYTLHPYTLQHTPSPFTRHFTPCTQHHTPYTKHHTLYTTHYTLYTLHCTPYTEHHALYTVHYTLFQGKGERYRRAGTRRLARDGTLNATDYSLFTVHCTLYTVHYTRYTLHFTLYTPYTIH